MSINQDYILKITNATPIGLVVISYDIMLESIKTAEKSYKTDPKTFVESLERAKGVLEELASSLNIEFELSKDLFSLYGRVNTLLLSALLYEKKEPLNEAHKILSILKEGWVKAEQLQPADEKLYKNAQKVYSGLTYGKNGLNDYVDYGERRGFKA